MGKQLATVKNNHLNLPGALSRTAWMPPANLSQGDWLACGKTLTAIEGSVQWWMGDWWVFGEERTYGEGREIAEQIGVDYGTIRTYGSVARAYELSNRLDNLSFTHHFRAMAVDSTKGRMKWLRRAEKEGWSASELKSAIAQQQAIDRTREVDLEAKSLGKFAILYADPPWRYENPPMGGSNRSIENHYPTMELDKICALPVNGIAHDNCVLFMWATSPKLAECIAVLDAWGFEHRTTMVWVKDKIGMGYHARERHEILLIAKRGELPPPPVDARPDSVVEAPRGEHSAKPPVFYDIIDRMYPDARKIELFARQPEPRKNWSVWGNQA